MHIPIGDILVSAAARDDRPGLLEERGVSLAGLNAHLLSVDVPRDGIIWGKGFDADRVGSLPWLVDVDLTYWGDIDTHGFAILDRLRAWLPQTQSTLMDR
ncbi:MAG: hypothetical protein QOF53_2909, partial [Nocardioidaceae bacterium]|nr:hypothetical protein [Nocardioidaceae bacterium]